MDYKEILEERNHLKERTVQLYLDCKKQIENFKKKLNEQPIELIAGDYSCELVNDKIKYYKYQNIEIIEDIYYYSNNLRCEYIYFKGGKGNQIIGKFYHTLNGIKVHTITQREFEEFKLKEGLYYIVDTKEIFSFDNNKIIKIGDFKTLEKNLSCKKNTIVKKIEISRKEFFEEDSKNA